MTERILFIGNGINRASIKEVSWSALLDTLAGDPANKHESKVRNKKPFTLWFEEIVSVNCSSLSLKESISTSLANLRTTDLHKSLIAMNIVNILTTNYDHKLENAAEEITGQKSTANSTAQESLYSLFRRRTVGEINIWHIHGEISNHKSIMLGHRHYSGYLQKIRNFLTAGVSSESKLRQKQPYYSRYAKQSPKNSQFYTESWVDKFLASEVHMIGFSMDYTENHLWNLLMQKRALKKNIPDIGDLYFHCRETKKLNIEEEAKRSLLHSLGAKVIPHPGKDHLMSYKTCLQWIRNRIDADHPSNNQRLKT